MKTKQRSKRSVEYMKYAETFSRLSENTKTSKILPSTYSTVIIFEIKMKTLFFGKS